MNSYQYLDELVREYFLFRGFTATLKSFDADLKNEKEKGFRVDKIVDQFSQSINNHDLTGLLELWKHLETKIFLRLETQRLVTVRKLENSLLKLYLVTCVQNKQLEKLREFYLELTPELQGQTEWKDWFALPYVKEAQDNQAFSLYFSRQWQETLFLSLNNFLSVVFQCLPPPRLTDFRKTDARFGALREELKRLKLRLASTELDVDLNIARGNFKHLEPPPNKENMDDFFLISQETAVVDNQVKSLRSFLRTITGGGISSDRKKSPVIGSVSRSSSKARQVLPSTSSSSSQRHQLDKSKKMPRLSSSSEQGIVSITCTNTRQTVSPDTCKYLLLGQETYRDHRATVSLLEVSGVGGRVVSADTSGVIKVWTASPTPLTLATFISGCPVTSLCWVGDTDKYLLYGTRAGQARLCDVTDMSVVEVSQDLLAGQPVTVLESGPANNTFLLCAGIKILLMETANCQLDRDLSHPSLKPIVCAQFNHNGSVLIHAGQDGKIGMTDLHRGELLCVWSVHSAPITAIGLTTDQTGLWSMAEDNIMAFSNIVNLNDKTWEGQMPVSEERSSKVSSKSFKLSSDEDFFLTNSDGGATIYRLPSVSSADVRFEKILELRSDEVVTSISWGPGECGPVLAGDSHGNMKKILRQSISSKGIFTTSIKNVRRFSVKVDMPSSGDSPTSREKFMSYFPDLSRNLSEDPDTPDLHPFLSEHLSSLASYTIPGGKMNRGLSVPQSYQLMVQQPDPADLELANILGWSVEVLQAFYLVADDIMDGSITRRGQPCWYKRSDIGLAAFNDSIILESLVYSLLKRHFRAKPYYLNLLENLLEVSKFTTFGQSLDTLSAQNFSLVRGSEESLESFDMARYTAIVKYKTSFYSFYLPVSLAMNMAGFTDPQLYNKAKDILLEIGHYFQATDDFLDCFADPEVIGKIGTDIQDGKCSWMIVKALAVASVEEKKILARHYGSQDDADVEIVKKIYRELGLVEKFREYERTFYDEIVEKINKVENEIPKEVFHAFLAKVYKRKL